MILYKIFYIIKVIKFKLNLNYVYYLNLNYLSYQIAFQIGNLTATRTLRDWCG